MSCPLLEKFAPETRSLIWEYVLTFDAPLRHIQQMRPFIEKFGQSTKPDTETSSSEEPSAVSDLSDRANTSILTTNKLVYNEAIPVFYKHNTIKVDAAICKPENTATLRATDLSLAAQVTAESELRTNATDGKIATLGDVAHFAVGEFATIFPKLKTVTIYLYTDALPTPVTALFAMAAAVRSTRRFGAVKFEGVGSVIAGPIQPPGRAKLSMVMQCKASVDRWANDEVVTDKDSVLSMSMRFVHDHPREKRPRTVDPIAQQFFDRLHDSIVPGDYGSIDTGGYEFWTVANEGLRQGQLRFQREQLARSAAVEDASSDSDSDSDYAPPSEEEDDEDDEEVLEDDGST